MFEITYQGRHVMIQIPKVTIQNPRGVQDLILPANTTSYLVWDKLTKEVKMWWIRPMVPDAVPLWDITTSDKEVIDIVDQRTSLIDELVNVCAMSEGGEHRMRPVTYVQCAAVLVQVHRSQALEACYDCGFVQLRQVQEDHATLEPSR